MGCSSHLLIDSITTQFSLTQKYVSFEWTKKCEDSFQKHKTLLSTTPTVALPMEGKDFIVYFDASHYDLWALLMQDKSVIAYAS